MKKKHVLIMGGGMIGLSAAFSLLKRGLDVTILEKSICGGQATGAAAGMLAPFSEISEDPDPFFTFCLESLRRFPEWQKEVKRESGMDFEYTESGSLHAVYHESDLLGLESRIGWQKRFGSEAEIVEGDRLQQLEPLLSDEVIAAIYSPDEAHVYAPECAQALEEACRKMGAVIEDRLESVTIRSWLNEPVLEAADGRRFSGDHLVVASGAWSGQLEDTFGLRIPVFPIRGQICAYDREGADVRHIISSSQGYLVPKANGTLVNGASEDISGFDTGVTEKGIARLVNWNYRMLPFLKERQPFHTWAGLRPATQDGFPLLGRLADAPHVIFATGHYRNGILLSPATGEAVADLIDGAGLEDHFRNAFFPERFS
ncbi:glycine oxidase ThiO [Alteribacter natronophilus]|uniref:glycine oxidase ThiO n=1 Tax=Alteribacter natronophilus TaxID=2583810 RepID=UPI00110D41B6|nr:glycine oxidase ThiO [Alteribacter natronophilus]TMW70420.1 glycine oxidase ThiO [Alteribacter natronophilus]